MSGTVLGGVFAPTFSAYEGSSLWVGEKFTAAAGVSTVFDYKLLNNANLFGGSVWCDSNAAIGDSMDFSVVDVDGIAAPPGTVLSTYIKSLYVVPQERRDLKSGKAAEIVAGLYLRTVYHSTGASDVVVLSDFLMFEL